jgi:hypothetical protein
MNNFAEFIRRIQTFNLRIITQDARTGNHQTKEAREYEAYDITRETQYYDSFSYRSEIRVLKDLALIDVLVLDKERISLLLEQLNKVKECFKELWQSYHEHYDGYYRDYKTSYPFSIGLDRLFIVTNLQGDQSGIKVTEQFVEDLGDSLKLRGLFLDELVREVRNLLPVNKEESASVKDSLDTRSGEQPLNENRIVNRRPTFTQGTAEQLLNILKPYFSSEDYTPLACLILENKTPNTPLVFRGNGNQLADAFKQLFDANIIVGCQQVDLEKWIAPNFLYLSNKGEIREFTEGYLNGMISTTARPCKSPILKIEQQGKSILIRSIPRNRKSQ